MSIHTNPGRPLRGKRRGEGSATYSMSRLNNQARNLARRLQRGQITQAAHDEGRALLQADAMEIHGKPLAPLPPDDTPAPPAATSDHALTERLEIRLSPAQRHTLDARQQASGLPMAEWLRQQLLAPASITDVATPELIALLIERGYAVSKAK